MLTSKWIQPFNNFNGFKMNRAFYCFSKTKISVIQEFLHTIFSMILLVYEIWSSLKKHIYYVESAESLATNTIFIETWSTRIDGNEN